MCDQFYLISFHKNTKKVLKNKYIMYETLKKI